MSTPLLAEANQSQEQDTAQGSPAQTDTQVKPEQKQVDAKVEGEKSQTKETVTQEKKPAEQADGAPELYEFEVPKGLPENHQLDEHVVDSFAEIARELNLSQDKAQKVIDKVIPTIHRRALEQQAEIHEQWREAVKADKTIGGQNLEENLSIAKKAVAAFGDSDLQQLLNGPLGSNPAMLRMLFKVGKQVSQDKFIGGDVKGSTVDLGDESALAKRLYPKSPS
jgi:hypothetical protein